MKLFHRLALCSIVSLSSIMNLKAADTMVLPDTQTPEFSSIVERYRTALIPAQQKHLSALTQHLQRYLDDASEMLKEKKKFRNTTGIAIASTACSIYESALSNLNATGTFELPAKVRRELENTLAEFNTGRTLIDTTLANEKNKLFKQYSDEFAAQVLKTAPALTSPEARSKIDERFKAMEKGSSPANSPEKPNTPAPSSATTTTGTAEDPVIAESGSSPSWTTIGTLTANIRAMEVWEINLAKMLPGTNVMKQYSAMSDSTTEIRIVITTTDFTSPTTMYRVLRIPRFNAVTIVDWPSDANGYHLNVRTPSPERIPCPVGFELQASTLTAPSQKAVTPPKRAITLSIRSTPTHAAVYLDGALQPEATPCTLQLPVGPHDFRLSFVNYQDLIVTNYNFTVSRDIDWTFKAIPAPSDKHR